MVLAIILANIRLPPFRSIWQLNHPDSFYLSPVAKNLKHRVRRAPAAVPDQARRLSRPQPELCPPTLAKYSPAGPGLLFRNPAWQNDSSGIRKMAQVWGWCEWLRMSLLAAALMAAGIALAAKTFQQAAHAQVARLRYAPALSSNPAFPPSAASKDGGSGAIGAIHYWSDDNSTTVTVGLPHLVFFAAHRLTSPDRIYFDLQGAPMPADLHGRLIQVPVTETFVRTIRIAERGPGVTRVVLETEHSCDYSAMIAPDPYRLIISLHAPGPGR